MPETKPSKSATDVNEDATVVSYVDLMAKATDAMIQGIVETQNATLAAAKATMEGLAQPVVMPTVPVPALPTLREVVEANFAFADKYLANQREYAAKVLDLHGI